MNNALDSGFDEAIDRAAAALEARDYRTAHEHCIAAIKRNPRRGEPYFLLSVLTADHHNYPKALEIAERGLALGGAVGGEDARLIAQRAKCLALLHRHAEASEAASAAAALGPEDVFSLETLGVIFSRIGEHARAVPLFRKAAALVPGNPEHHYNLGASLQFSGDFDGAEAAYSAALALKPDHHKSHYGLATLRSQRGEAGRLESLQALFETVADPDAALHLGHAIAKTLEDMDAHEAAMATLHRAKAAKRAVLGYDFASDAALFDAARALADIAPLPLTSDGPGPIFITGMPRTGTTLTDRILSSHSQVVSMGELAYFGLFVKQAAQTPSPFVLDAKTLARVGSIDLSAIGAQYLAATQRLRGDAPGFIDKMPLNFFYAPLLLASIPNARIICMKRGGMDTCVSNYRQLFSTSYSYYNYSYDLADTARFFLAFEALVEHWQAQLPPERFTVVEYEAVVRDQEHETRRLLAFAGLEFEPQCLDFHANPAPIATASSVQVRKPIYKSSVERWRKYGETIAPLEQVMRDAGRI